MALRTIVVPWVDMVTGGAGSWDAQAHNKETESGRIARMMFSLDGIQNRYPYAF